MSVCGGSLSPARLGYAMPAEWAPHQATWLAWPKNPDTWGEGLEEVQETFVRIIDSLVPGEEVHLLVDTEEMELLVHRRLGRKPSFGRQLHFHRIHTTDAWMRDYGPNFLLGAKGQQRRLGANLWTFNAWGNTYPEHLDDDWVAKQLIRACGPVQRFDPHWVLEGGAIEVNGAGLCLTSESCLLGPARNPHVSLGQTEDILKAYLGVDKIVWLKGSIAGDDTDGHVDQMARFVNSDTVLCALEEDSSDENFMPLRDNYQRLASSVERANLPLRLLTLPMPHPVIRADQRLPASYANFYIANRPKMVLSSLELFE